MINAIQAFVNVPPKEGQVAVEFLVDVFDPITGMTINSRGNYPILLTEELLSMLKSWREADDSRFVYFVEK
jgi:hypothetical protein